MNLQLLFLTRYAALGASSRMRAYQFLPALQEAGWGVQVQPLIDDAALQGKYRSGAYPGLGLLAMYARRVVQMLRAGRFDLTWIEKEAVPWFPATLERVLLRGRPYVLDFDDAVFHNYDRHRLAWVRHLLGHRIDHLMAGARLVVAGNGYLAERARAAGARWVEVLPTVVDMQRYPARTTQGDDGPLRVVWIGSPSTAQYLQAIAPELARMHAQQPFVLRVIGAGALQMPGVEVESMAWSLDSEAALLQECHVGIMPLHDSPWERGKCAYKLIQYMACGLPTVASAVGANQDVVLEGQTGFLVSDPSQWQQQLGRLLADASLRQALGRAGRLRAQQHYSLQVAAPQLTRWLKQAAEQSPCAG